MTQKSERDHPIRAARVLFSVVNMADDSSLTIINPNINIHLNAMPSK